VDSSCELDGVRRRGGAFRCASLARFSVAGEAGSAQAVALCHMPRHRIPGVRKSELLSAAILIGVLLAGCAHVEIAPQQFPYQAMLAADDLGPGWQVEQSSYPSVGNAVSAYSVTFRYGDLADATEPFLAHQLTIYSDSASARAGYVALRDQFNLDRPSDPAMVFVPRATSDVVASHCERLSMNGKSRISCILVQQHNAAVSFVDGLLDEQELTFEEFMKIVQELDDRLNKLELSRPRNDLEKEEPGALEGISRHSGGYDS
jgi:hypothetical protein